MAVRLEFINVLIPIENINECNLEGGFNELLKLDEQFIGSTKWFDKELYREGAMNVLDIEMILRKWENRGLILFEETDTGRIWKDLCVVDSSGGLSFPCSWIELNLKAGNAHYRIQPE